MSDFKYGQLLISNQKTESRLALSDEVVEIPKGNRVVGGYAGRI